MEKLIFASKHYTQYNIDIVGDTHKLSTLVFYWIQYVYWFLTV